MTKLRALDLFCGAGGVTKGLQNAGCHVTGVDIYKSPRYVGEEFWQMDALDLSIADLWNFDFIWASPPCQHNTALRHMHNAKQHTDLITDTRHMLAGSGRPFVIENVPGAALINPIKLRGTMFGLGVADKAQLLRERWFETSFPVEEFPVDEYDPSAAVIGVYGGHYRNRSRGVGLQHVHGSDFTAAEGREAMGIDWMSGTELSQAIPPAYSEFIARQWLLTKQVSA